MAGSYGKCVELFQKLPNSFLKWLNHFTFSPAVCESSGCLTSSSTPGKVSLFHFNHYSGCVVVSTCSSFYLFIYFWPCWVFIAAHGLSLVAVSRWWLLLLQSTGSRRADFSSCGTQAQQLWRMGLVAPRHVGSSQTKARTRVPCLGRWILNHCATREAPYLWFLICIFLMTSSIFSCAN